LDAVKRDGVKREKRMQEITFEKGNEQHLKDCNVTALPVNTWQKIFFFTGERRKRDP